MPHPTGLDRPTDSELRVRAEVEQTLNRYGQCADAGDVDGWLELFCADAEMELPDYVGHGPRTTRVAGHDRLRREVIDNPVMRSLRGRSRHDFSGARMLAVDGDIATAETYLAVYIRPAEGGAPVPSVSLNRWTLRRDDQRWRIARCVRTRVDSPLPPAPRPTVDQASEPLPVPESVAVTRINHTAVSVSDIARSIRFYTERLGFRVVATQPAIERIPGMASVVGYDESTLHAAWALLGAGPTRLELVCYRSPLGRRPEGPRPPADVGQAHLALETELVDDLHANLVAAGVPVLSDPVTLGRHRAFYAWGPDGELLEILEEYSPDPPNASLQG